MSSSRLQVSPEETIRMLQRELAETNREVIALTLELEKRVEERTTALQTAQEELERKNARLQASNKELEAFSYSVSHDLRAPLRHIEGYAQALREDFALDPKAMEYVAHITEAVGQMNELIKALLSFSRTALQPLNQVPVNSDNLVRQVMAQLKPEQAGRRVEWVVASLPPVVGDPTLLRQVWSNLIGNALKYTRGKDPARIEVGCDEKHSETHVAFFVRDNGAGFDMADTGKLFGLFQRLHRREEFEGTGLGLANVRRIIDRHSGRTWAEGTPGKGATFYFSLPKPNR
jgi:two-component system, chemotaxis family, sensor kinase Cph1